MINQELLGTLVEFHKILADETRLKLIGLLSLRPWCGQDLALELGVSAPTISHHIGKLKKLQLVNALREDNTIYYALDVGRLRELNRALLSQEDPAESVPVTKERLDERQKAIRDFFADDRLKALPAQRKKKLFVLEEILKAFESGREYQESEVNAVILRFFDDFCTIRREFIMNGYMRRDKGIYTVNPEEEWYPWK